MPDTGLPGSTRTKRSRTNGATGSRSAAFQPSASLNYTISPTRRIYVNYSSNAQQPGSNRLRNELNYQNPLSLSGGNPDLKQSNMHSVYIGYTAAKTEKSRTFSLNFNGSVTAREIATKQVFFTEDTPLPEYNGYIAPKGATLTTPVNVNGAGSMRLGAGYSLPVKALDITFSANAGCAYSRRPTYIGDGSNYTNSLSEPQPQALIGNKSLVYQFSLYTNTAYNRVKLPEIGQQHDQPDRSDEPDRQHRQKDIRHGQLQLLALPQLLVRRRRREHAHPEPNVRLQKFVQKNDRATSTSPPTTC